MNKDDEKYNLAAWFDRRKDLWGNKWFWFQNGPMLLKMVRQYEERLRELDND